MLMNARRGPGDIIWFRGGLHLVIQTNRKTYTIISVVSLGREGSYKPVGCPQQFPIWVVDNQSVPYESDKRLLRESVADFIPKKVPGTLFISSPGNIKLKHRCVVCSKPFKLGDRLVIGQDKHYDCDNPQE